MAFPPGTGYRAHPGTKRRKYLEENAEAARIESIEETAPKDAAAGDRYADIGTINL